MNLYQVLRLIDDNIPITLFDIQYQIIQEASSKKYLSPDFFDYDVFKITVSFTTRKNTLFIILFK